MIVKNKTLRVIIAGAAKLIPGMNEISEEVAKASEKQLAYHVEKRHIEVPKLEIEDDLEEGIVAYKANDAISLIEETHDEAKLMEYLEQEKAGKSRVSVVKAIETKIQEAKDAMNNDDAGDLD